MGARGGKFRLYSCSLLRASPDQFERNLDLPGGGLRGGNEACAGNGQAVLIEDGQVLGWGGEIGTVENVKEFRPELSIEILRNALHGIVLENREIQIRYPWPNQAISTQISPAVGAGKGEALSFDIGVGVAGIGQRSASRSSTQTGRLARLVQFHSSRIAA